MSLNQQTCELRAAAIAARAERAGGPPPNWVKPPLHTAEYRQARRLGWITEAEEVEDKHQEMAASAARLSARLDERRRRAGPKPRDWVKPAFNTPEYREAVAVGWISSEEADADHLAYAVRRERALETTWRRKPLPRSERPQPIKNGQFARAMSTEAARSQRLTAGAKALLQIVAAYCGRKGHWLGTKTFLARAMGVSPRTVQRYLADLEAEGFLLIDIDQSSRTGMVRGLLIRLGQKVLPRWLHSWWAKNVAFLDKTELSPNNPLQGTSIIKYSRSRWRSMCNSQFKFPVQGQIPI